jgi:hypothetical protein
MAANARSSTTATTWANNAATVAELLVDGLPGHPGLARDLFDGRGLRTMDGEHVRGGVQHERALFVDREFAWAAARGRA